jgi:hypothetical protein
MGSLWSRGETPSTTSVRPKAHGLGRAPNPARFRCHGGSGRGCSDFFLLFFFLVVFRMLNDDGCFPLYGYVYNGSGCYHGPELIQDQEALERFRRREVMPALAEKREIRITDILDCLVFHAKNGRILFPRPGDAPQAAACV